MPEIFKTLIRRTFTAMALCAGLAAIPAAAQ
jgi:hypothetical protein